MSKTNMGKVQTYNDLASFFRNSAAFLKQAEFQNNLFWEMFNKFGKTGKPAWVGNVFLDGRIAMSGLITPTGYLLLSDGESRSIERLVNYGKSKNWKIKGVTGPSDSAMVFRRKWLGAKSLSFVPQKEFMIYDCPCTSNYKKLNASYLQVVEPRSWPRVQAWTTIFANESSPPINASALLSVSSEMMKRGNLFILRKEGLGPCAMGGFGRSTPKSLVINEVFVPRELRGKGYGSELISGLIGEARHRGVANCILFSDFKGEKNLYDRLGFQKVVEFCEEAF